MPTAITLFKMVEVEVVVMGGGLHIYTIRFESHDKILTS